MVDKDFCLSAFMAFRYTWRDDIDFWNGFHHRNYHLKDEKDRFKVSSAEEMDAYLTRYFDELHQKYEHPAILLSGGMDSGILASYMKPGEKAYTFTTDLSTVFNDDLRRARLYADKAGLELTEIDISFEDFKKYTPIVMAHRGNPVHSIEPELYKAAIIALKDGTDMLVEGESADDVFGGIDKLLSRDWTYDEFVKRYTYLDPELVLTNPVSQSEAFDNYRTGENSIDWMGFLGDYCTLETASSFNNAFMTAGMAYADPFGDFALREPLDIQRIRNGEPKYLIRELFAIRYPDIPIPEKLPMPRPVDAIFKDWKGPERPEFRKDIPMDRLTGNQKWQLWCAELFLDLFD